MTTVRYCARLVALANPVHPDKFVPDSARPAFRSHSNGRANLGRRSANTHDHEGCAQQRDGDAPMQIIFPSLMQGVTGFHGNTLHSLLMTLECHSQPTDPSRALSRLFQHRLCR